MTRDDKPALRRQLRAARRAYVDDLAPDARARLLGALAARVIPRIGNARIVASYKAVGGEIDPRPVAEALAARGAVVALPRVAPPSNQLSFHLADGALETGLAGIAQPRADAPRVAPDLVLVPLVAADVRCNRLGQGAGYYDRALAELRSASACRAIGLAWDVQIVTALPVDPWDQPLDAVATPTRWITPI